MKTSTYFLAGALLVGAPLALTGCETETQREVEADGDVDYDTEIGVDEADLQEIEAGARELGQDIEQGAESVGDAVDRNVDLGDDAEDQ
jgi:hypothetical protein